MSSRPITKEKENSPVLDQITAAKWAKFSSGSIFKTVQDEPTKTMVWIMVKSTARTYNGHG